MVLIMALVGFIVLNQCSKEPDHLIDITVAVAVQPMSATLYVAHEKGFFKQEGLHVTLKNYAAGIDAMNAALNGKTDFGTVADTPLAFAGLQGKRISIIATIGDSRNYVKIAARKDRNISGPEDLQGKTIGVMSNTSSEYFIYSFLNFNGIKKESVRIVDIKAENIADAIARGDIDAVAIWEPYLSLLEKRLGTNAIILENNYIYQLYWNIVAARDYVRRNPETIRRLLAALIQATEYIAVNPVESREITARNIGKERIALDDYFFDVYLDQSLIVNLENQARWAIGSRLTDKREVPNYLDMFSTEGLRSIKPEAVSVIQK